MSFSRPIVLGALFAALALAMVALAAPAAAAPAAFSPKADHAGYSPSPLQQGGELTPTLYLPFVGKPPPPAAPLLNAVNNPLNTGVYEVTWQAVPLATAYIAEESSDPAFGTITGTGGGPGVLSWAANQGRAGTWYYRVKAVAPWGESVWSNVVSTTATPGMAGIVTAGGVPLSGIHLRLRFYDGAVWSTALETDTGAGGAYRFVGASTAAPNQLYYVRYDNSTDFGNTPSDAYLFYWGGANIVAYQAGAAIPAGNFDIANVDLVSPVPGATVGLPATFQWQPRTPAPGEGYWWELFEPAVPGSWYGPSLGYVGSYTVTGLPSGFVPGTQYGWAVWVYDASGGSGASYYYRRVTFSGGEALGAPTVAFERRHTPGNRMEALRVRDAAPANEGSLSGR